MANPEHLVILKEGVKAWNSWRDTTDEVPDLSAANLSEVHLDFADLSGADLRAANLRAAYLEDTVFTNVDLSEAIGLETCVHHGPSSVDLRTLERSGLLPDEFLRGVGFSDSYIEYLSSLFGSGRECFFAFIRHSSADDDFCHNLLKMLQREGVRCLLDAHQITPGDEIGCAID